MVEIKLHAVNIRINHNLRQPIKLKQFQIGYERTHNTQIVNMQYKIESALGGTSDKSEIFLKK